MSNMADSPVKLFFSGSVERGRAQIYVRAGGVYPPSPPPKSQRVGEVGEEGEAGGRGRGYGVRERTASTRGAQLRSHAVPTALPTVLFNEQPHNVSEENSPFLPLNCHSVFTVYSEGGLHTRGPPTKVNTKGKDTPPPR